MKICVIPARGGSKRIPNKNIKEFCGKPIIAWSIETALASGCFDKVIISTDDQAIADVAMEYGAEVPFFRPGELADDYTGTVAVISHAVNWVKNNWGNPDYVCCLYATAPFVKTGDIKSAFDKIKLGGHDYVFAAAMFESPVQRAFRLSKDSKVEMLQPNYLDARSQDLEDVYYNAGQFYWGTAEAWVLNKRILTSNSSAVMVPRDRVQDIDTIDDWKYAEFLFSWSKKN